MCRVLSNFQINYLIPMRFLLIKCSTERLQHLASFASLRELSFIRSSSNRAKMLPALNSNSENRDPKQYQNSNYQNLNLFKLFVLEIRIYIIWIVSNFGFRAANLHFCLTLASFVVRLCSPPRVHRRAPLRESSFIRFPKPKFNGKFQICLVRVFSFAFLVSIQAHESQLGTSFSLRTSGPRPQTPLQSLSRPGPCPEQR